ncbi:MAG: tyrosine-type recombinase/integrase [Oscillatoria sp. SIO1A7]|nr:tyrosine-type recombinase/integrase [Oscillatoria sp. SIO1A7]
MGKNNRCGQAAILTDDDYAKILQQLKNPTHQIALQIARYTVERVGAITKLQISDVYADVSQGEVLPEITFQANTRKAAPGGKRETRQVPVHPTLKELLQLYRPPTNSRWLFPSPRYRDQPVTVRAMDKWLKKALARANLSHKGASWHSPRRTGITTLSNAGKSVKVIQAVTGHKSLAALMRYIEVTPQAVENAIAVL